jgi:uncharacterized membrane protein
MQTTKKTPASFINTRQLAIVGLLSGISILLSMTPLGFIPIPPINATIMHIPVVIGAILEGPVVGALIGLIFGVTSFAKAFATPTPLSFIFWNPIISIGVRILIGVVSAYVYRLLGKSKTSVVISALAGSLTNTIGVMGLIYLFYVAKYAETLGISLQAAKAGIIGVVVTSGIPEAILCSLVTLAVVTAVKKSRKAR